MRSRVRNLLAPARFAFARCWRAARALTLAFVAVPIVQSLLPAALVLTIRGLVDELVRLQHQSSGGTGSIGKWILAGLAVSVLSGLLAAVATYVDVTLAGLLEEHVAVEIMSHANQLDYAVFEDREFQDTLTHINEQPADHLQQFVGGAIGMVAAVIRVVSLLAILLTIEPLLLLVLAPLALPYLVFFSWVSTKRYEETRSQLTKRRWVRYYVGQLTSAPALAEIRVLDLGSVFIERTKAILQDVRRRNLRFYRLQLAGTALFVAASLAAIYLALYNASKDVLAGHLTVGDIAIFGATALSLRTAVDSLINVAASFRWHTLHVSELRTFLALPHRAETAAVAQTSARRGQLDLEHVTFTYPGTDRQVLRDVNLHIAPGETVAIVGENGSGKSTLVKLIAGLYVPDEGQVQLDGVEVRTISTKDLADQVSFVVQEFGRYAATAGENIAFGDWAQMLDQPDRIRAVIDDVGISELIDRMPDGVDTLLGRQFGSHEPSGGQWQQIAIARANCRHAVVQILDEPTSNLDVKTEYAVFSKFRDLADGRTTVLISHRFSTVSLADRIVVMHEGQLVEDGTHADLLAKEGFYAQLYRLHRRDRDEAAPRVDEA